MAKVTQADLAGKVESKLSSNIALPRDRYTVRCVKEESVLAKSSGNFQIVRTWEVVQPDHFMLNGVKINISGTQVIQYLPIKAFEEKDGKSAATRTAEMQNRYFDEQEKLGFPREVDDENPELLCQGVIADAILGSEEYIQRKEPTAEQRAAKKQGDPIEIDGKPVKRFNPRLIEIYGKSTLSVNAPY